MNVKSEVKAAISNFNAKYDVSTVKPVSVPITFPDGVTRSLFFDLNALCLLESECGMTYDEGLKKLNKGSPVAMRAFLWAGLVHADEEISLEQVGAWIVPQNISSFTDAIVDALQQAVPLEEVPVELSASACEEGAESEQDFCKSCGTTMQ